MVPEGVLGRVDDTVGIVSMMGIVAVVDCVVMVCCCCNLSLFGGSCVDLVGSQMAAVYSLLEFGYCAEVEV